MARAVLDKLLATRQFSSARKLSDFLRFVTLKTAAGEHDEIKEYVIALEVYGRKADYDPKIDSIVRVEASRLRAKLRNYYENDGRGDRIRLRLPLGSYIPVFDVVAETAPAPTPVENPVHAAPLAVEPTAPYRWTAVILAIALLTTAVLIPLARQPAKTRNSIAVLPFANLSGNPGKDYFSDGLTEQIANELGRSEKLQVAARTSTLRFKDRGDDVRVIGEQLHVDKVLEGSVRFAQDRVRITARLYDTQSGNQIWSNEFERPAGDVLALQDEISAAIVRALQPGAVSSGSQTPRGWTSNSQALDIYLQARYFFNSRKPENLRKSIELYQQALAKDPGFALAWAGMADAYVVLGANEEQDLAQMLPLARRALDRALSIDPQLPEALLTRAAISDNGTFRILEDNFRAALAANPSNATGHHWFGLNLMAQGRFSEAEAEIRQAQLLDPLSLHVGADLGMVYYCSRRYPAAVEQARKLLALDGQLIQGRLLLAAGDEALARYDEAAAVLEQVLTNDSNPGVLASLGHIYAASGKPEQARAMIDRLTRLAGTRHVSPHHFAMIYAGLGQKEEALARLTKNDEQHEAPLAFLKVDPRWDPLRGDARFQQLLRGLDLQK